ncbi:MAG TPA: sulfatase-like hydrolase/transferase [Verrucomicrobiae bacterium]|jgi:arylsulfatase A-like enzyme|nr:sulfatase-like hydrolase/transferase [Verrucomicrobiae bacterium]
MVNRIYAIALVLLGMAHSACLGQKPNIVFILTDDMGYSDLNCYGGNFAPTPNLDRLAKQGVRFTHFYDNAPICSPSRAAFVTGMYPARWNFTTYLDNRARNRDCEQTDFLPPTAPAIARVLKTAGYATAHFGKWHLGGGRDVTNAPPFSAYGYDEHIGTWESPEPDPNITATDWIWSPKDSVKRWDRTRYFVDHALDFLRRHKDQSCYVEIWPDDVHTPWVPNLEREAENPKSAEERDFSGVLAEYDYQMGRFFEGLKSLGLEENTIVIFTSDNGPLPSFHHARTGGLRGSKLSLYEGGIRVPFIVRWPGHTTAGRVDEGTVLEAVDLFPTLCAIAHATPPSGVAFDGENMTETLVNEPIAHARTIFWEYGRKSKFFNYPGPVFDRSPHIAVREGKWKLLVNADGTSTELYNMEADMGETNNLVQQEAETAQRLKAAALAWRRSLPKL